MAKATKKPRERQYNVRLIVTGDKVELGFVHGLYACKPEVFKGKKMPCGEWREVPRSIRAKLIKRLGAIGT